MIPSCVYLKGPKTKINDTDYIEERQGHIVTVNGEEMTVEEFRRRSPKSRKGFTGLKRKK